jgi:uncharacterized protein (DUF4415 family)
MKRVAAEPYRDIDFSQAKRGSGVKAKPGKTKISIRLDNAVIESFREMADRAGGGNYQTLINDALIAYLYQRSMPETGTRKAGIDTADIAIARELRQRLEQGLQIEDFRLYGSRARGDATPDSDLNIYIVVTELTPALRRWIGEIAWEVGFDNDRVISTLVTTRQGLEQGPFGAQPIVQTIEREGIPI